MAGILEDIVVYSFIVGVCIFIYFRFIHANANANANANAKVEGFANVTDVQNRINADIESVRKGSAGLQAFPTFFTQTSSMPYLPDNQSFLVNICPLTAYLGGYLGPPEKLMDANVYLKLAFQAGIRSFILPISTYVNPSKTPPDWPMSKEPALVCRDNSDIIISDNGLSIERFIQALVSNKSIAGAGLNSDPIIIYLEDHVSDVDKTYINYVHFMKKIVAALKPLDPYRLTTFGSYGSCVGGTAKQQNMLLTQIPLSAMNNKILIFTNFDTAQDDSNSLASYANFIYSPTDNTLPVRSIMLEDIAGTTVNYVSNARINWYIAHSKSPLLAPSIAAVEGALKNGIQCIPIPFLSTPMSTVSDIWALWKNASSRLKDEKARYTRPDPVVPSKVNSKLNASIEGKEPGSLVVR